MLNLKNLKPNIPKANIEDYVFVVYGRPKAGKTSLFAKTVKQFYKDISAGLLLAFEKGYKALEVMAQDINSWEEFLEVVRQLEKEKGNLPFKTICIDTADIMYKYASDYIVLQESRNDGKKYDDISDIPYGKGYSLVANEILNVLQRIIKAGYGLWILTHDKEKSFRSRDGETYDKVTCSLPATARDVILNIADFIIFIDIAKEKDGDKLKDVRYMYFRADGSDIEAGSRFENVPIKIQYDITEFLNTFEEAVKSSFSDNNIDLNEIKIKQKEEKEKIVKQYLEEIQSNKSIEELRQEIREKLTAKIKAGMTKQQARDLLIEIAGVDNISLINDIEIAQKILDKVKEEE